MNFETKKVVNEFGETPIFYCEKCNHPIYQNDYGYLLSFLKFQISGPFIHRVKRNLCLKCQCDFISIRNLTIEVLLSIFLGYLSSLFLPSLGAYFIFLFLFPINLKLASFLKDDGEICRARNNDLNIVEN